MLYTSKYDTIIAFVSTQLRWKDEFDVSLHPNEENGLKADSLIKLNKIATLEKSLALGRIGRLNRTEKKEVDLKLKRMFNLE